MRAPRAAYARRALKKHITPEIRARASRHAFAQNARKQLKGGALSFSFLFFLFKPATPERRIYRRRADIRSAARSRHARGAAIQDELAGAPRCASKDSAFKVIMLRTRAPPRARTRSYAVIYLPLRSALRVP